MKVNICPRLINKMIKNGNKFVSNPIIYSHNDIPLGVYAEKPYKEWGNYSYYDWYNVKMPNTKKYSYW